MHSQALAFLGAMGCQDDATPKPFVKQPKTYSGMVQVRKVELSRVGAGKCLHGLNKKCLNTKVFNICQLWPQHV